jgi:hypothetical protein
MTRWVWVTLALAACAEAEQQVVGLAEETSMASVELPVERPLRAGAAEPVFESVTLGDRGYAFALVRDGGGYSYTRADGTVDYNDIVLIGGTEEKLEAVDVYLAVCDPGTARVDAWGDEYVPRLTGNGAWIFDYPGGCAARESVPAG